MLSCATQGDFLVERMCVEDNREEYGVLCLFEEEVNRQISSAFSHNTDSWFCKCLCGGCFTLKEV